MYLEDSVVNFIVRGSGLGILVVVVWLIFKGMLVIRPRSRYSRSTYSRERIIDLRKDPRTVYDAERKQRAIEIVAQLARGDPAAWIPGVEQHRHLCEICGSDRVGKYCAKCGTPHKELR
jgi:hypothetical protein